MAMGHFSGKIMRKTRVRGHKSYKAKNCNLSVTFRRRRYGSS